MKKVADDFLKGLNKKDYDSFHWLYTNYYRSLVVYAITFVEQKEIAEDLIQDLFINLWESNIEIRSEISLKAFLYNSTKNRCLNYLKHIGIENKYAEKVQLSPEESTNLDSQIEEEEIYRQLFLEIEKLPPRCREIFEMNLSGKRNNEIAEILKISIETVKTQKKKAIRILKNKIQSGLLMEIIGVILHYN